MPVAQQVASAWWGVGVGLALLLLGYFAVRSGWFRKGLDGTIPDSDVMPEAVEPIHHYPEGLAEAHGKVPFVLKLVIGGYLVFLVGYVVQFLVRMQGPLGALDRFLTR